MASVNFWKIVSVLGVVGLFYVGHGLHGGRQDPPLLVNSAKAGGVTVQNATDGTPILITCSQDGRQVHFFGPALAPLDVLGAKHLGTVSARP
jgi:hypothetical protein